MVRTNVLSCVGGCAVTLEPKKDPICDRRDNQDSLRMNSTLFSIGLSESPREPQVIPSIRTYYDQ
eukprot:393842-Amphidinium_carterae.1